MSNKITVSGNLAADPELRYTPNGKAVVSLRLADTPRRLNPQTKEFEDGTTLWLKVTAWDALAENTAASLVKGSRVVVTGTLVQENYKTKEGADASSIKINADEISPSLKNAVARVEKKTSASSYGSNGGNSAPVAAAPSDDETPF